MNRPVRIGNVSGFYGDRIAAAREMVHGGGDPVDVVTGDYLAELTMLILAKARRKDPSAGYARTFLTQLEEILGTCLDRGTRIVVNAGGLNPAGLAEQVHALAGRLGLSPRVAHVSGDDLTDRLDELGPLVRHLDTGVALTDAAIRPVTANAYLGGWGIVEALAAGADVVLCGRVTDAALVTGPTAWWHGWGRDDLDALAGAVVAGHVIECGPQATGGNYSWLSEVVDRRYPGFPIAEVDGDGSSTITKHPDTGGLVSVGTVTAQLLYEIGAPAYLGPDVVAHFDTCVLTQAGPDRVRITGTRGSPAPDTLKVAVNADGGHRNTMTLVLTGLDIEEKAAWAREELFAVLGGEEQFDEVDVRLLRFDHPDPPTNAAATAHLRVSVKSTDPELVGRRFSSATMELALGGYAGFHTTTPPTPSSAFGVYWPALVPAECVHPQVTLPDGSRSDVAPTSGGPRTDPGPTPRVVAAERPDAPGDPGTGPTRRAPLGRVCAARSGDKGGDANVGVWTRDDAGFSWLRAHLSVERLRELLPEARGLRVERHELPNLRALNFVVHGLLGDGVASSTRPDPQAKGLGEWLRSRVTDVPTPLLDDAAT